jgi:hypothetical protein
MSRASSRDAAPPSQLHSCKLMASKSAVWSRLKFADDNYVSDSHHLDFLKKDINQSFEGLINLLFLVFLISSNSH